MQSGSRPRRLPTDDVAYGVGIEHPESRHNQSRVTNRRALEAVSDLDL